jgi:hypothetical protein
MNMNLIKALVQADVPVLLWGPPGVGKTASLLAMADSDDCHVEVLVGSTLDPIDVGGYLVPDSSGTVRSTPPPWARRISAALADGRKAWLILDELSCAPPSVQAALLRVVNERRVGECNISGCRVMAAANPSDTAADGGSLSAATANRWAHLDWSVDAKAWSQGELSGWGFRGGGTGLASARASITAYISRNPTSLLQVPKDAAQERAWPSPRSWSAAARALAVAPAELAVAAVSACVGPGAANQWAEWRLQNDLPDPEDMLSGKAKVPDRGDRAYAALFAVVSCAGTEHPQRDSRMAKAWKILSGCRPDISLGPASSLLDMSDGEVPPEAMGLAARLRGAGVK